MILPLLFFVNYDVSNIFTFPKTVSEFHKYIYDFDYLCNLIYT